MKRKDPPKPQRNAPCSCGSGKKYKKCHLLIEREEAVKAAAEREERRKARAAEIQRQRENYAGSRQAHGTLRNPWILALAAATLSSLHRPKGSRNKFV